MPNVASSVLTPGFALSVNLVSGDQSVGSAPRRALLIAPKATGGNITADAEVRQGLAGPDAVAAALGPGTPGHLAAKAIFAEYPLAQIDLVAPAAPSGVAASQTLTFDDTTPVTVQQTVTIKVAGRTLTLQWAPGTTKIQMATATVAAIGAMSNDLPISAANGGGTLAVVTATAVYPGTWGNDITISVSLSSGTGGAATAGGAKFTSGTTEIDVATALTLVAGTEYDLFGLVTSNTDAASSAGTSNPAKIKAAFSTLSVGFASKLQQMIYAHTAAVSAAKTGVAAINSGIAECVYARGAQSLPAEFMGAELGARLREESIDPDVNRTNRSDLPYRATLYVSANLTTDALSPPELEDALQNGLAAVVYTTAGVPFICIPRTTYFKDSNSNPDHRLVFVSQTTSLFAVGKDLRTYLPQRFAGCKVVPQLTPGDDEIPPNVVDEDTVKQVALARVRLWQRAGVVRKDKLDAAVAAGTFIVKVDSGNSSKLNCQFPTSIVPPLTTFDVTVLGS